MTPPKPYEIITYPNGTHSLKQVATGEIMHSRIGPWEEANLLYIEQSKLTERLSQTLTLDPLVLYDVGMGIAANAIGALRTTEEARTPDRKLDIHSFENDLDGMRFALTNPEQFPYLQGYEAAIKHLLANRIWHAPNGRVSWHLHEGDFFKNIAQAPEPELVFWDFYAPKSCPELWTTQAFKKLYEKTARRRALQLATNLFTYSASTPVRTAMLLAGFYVGNGRSTSMKADTTTASTRKQELESPLDSQWLKKLERSQNPFPHDWAPEQRDLTKLLARILCLHPFSD